MSGFTHFDANGDAVMVDVSAKDVTSRTATAAGSVVMQPDTLALIMNHGVAKGDVLSVKVELVCDPERNTVDITATCKLNGRTGVEMEALTAVSIAALTVYDMCKAVDRGMRIGDIKLLHKDGGKSGEWRGG